MENDVDEVPSETFIRGRDVFERMNYLYQLMNLWSSSHPELSAHYAKLLVSISKKSVLRLDSSIKRSICKGCYFHFLDGSTVRTRYTRDHQGQVVKVCNVCGVVKRFPVPRNKKDKTKMISPR